MLHFPECSALVANCTIESEIEVRDGTVELFPGGVHLDAAVEGDVVLRVETGVAAVVCWDERGALLVVFRRGGGRREAPRRPELALRRRTLERPKTKHGW